MTIFLHPIGTMELAPPPSGLMLTAGGGSMGQTARFHSIPEDSAQGRDDPVKASPKTWLGAGLRSSSLSLFGALDRKDRGMTDNVQVSRADGPRSRRPGRGWMR
jgi:hypothetical protein